MTIEENSEYVESAAIAVTMRTRQLAAACVNSVITEVTGTICRQLSKCDSIEEMLLAIRKLEAGIESSRQDPVVEPIAAGPKRRWAIHWRNLDKSESGVIPFTIDDLTRDIFESFVKATAPEVLIDFIEAKN